ncbi:DUF433 domain-containing protein [Candidatus Curtissbacteria bacterium]|nr:DUF433 domain-containing protein [Candidatus Curtissbacteria bacterium]
MKQTHIISDPKVLGGKPVISGTRISVELILDRVASGMSVKEILKDYPHLTAKQVQAALSYARSLVIKKSPRSKMDQPEPTTLYTHEISR